jgi:uncharacterized protein (DUF1501 family)
MSRIPRRKFLGQVSLGLTIGALSPLKAFIPARGSWPEDSNRNIIVLQLSGGNDGLSTVVPYGDDAYYKARNRTAIPAGEVLKLNNYHGLHPNLTAVSKLYANGLVSILPAVGYENPDRSHFKSLEIWHAADARGKARGSGWLGRLCDHQWQESNNPALSVHVGARPTYSLQSLAHPPLSFSAPEAYKWVGLPRESEALKTAAPICEHGPEEMANATTTAGRDRALLQLRETLAEATASSVEVRKAASAFNPKVQWPASPLAANLATVCALLSSDIGTRVYSLELGGFDTHNNQRTRHDQLMRQLDDSLGAFFNELKARDLSKRVTVLVFSEFGRRVQENGSAGTDHGAAGPVFLLGEGLKGGIASKAPSLEKLNRGDIIHTVDFRQIYASVIREWLQADARSVLGDYQPLGLYHA